MYTNRRWSVQMVDNGIERYCENQGYNTAYKFSQSVPLFNGILGGLITKVALEQ